MSTTCAEPAAAAPPGGPRVVIVGGGLMGLSLALMLEREGIDYVLLEGRGEIAPQVGAGVAFMANALRIVDQLGLLDEFMEQSIRADALADWWPDGACNGRREDAGAVIEAATGYPMIVLDRQQAMQILYRDIRDKSKVLTNKWVTAIQESETGVRVTVNGDEEFVGDMLVGADGVRSTVRKEMWRIGEEREPGCFEGDREDAISCNFKALFGISKLDGEVPPGANNTVGPGQAIALMAGRDRGYFVFYNMLPKELRGAEIRQYTADERDEMAERCSGAALQGNVKFGDLYEKRVRSVLVPLQKYAFKRWHFGRIICLGDTVHKMHPVTGQGGAQCLEDAVTFINLLTARLAATPTPTPLTAGAIRALYADLNRARQPRAAALVAESFLAGSMHCWRNPVLKFFYMHVVPRLGLDLVLQQFIATTRAAPRLAGPRHAPSRRAAAGCVGFDDDHPEPPAAARARYAVQAAAISALLVYAACPLFFGPSTTPNLAPPALAGPLTVMLVEGWRASNKLSPLQWPLLWALLGDFTAAGWAAAAPLFYAATLAALLYRGRLQFAAPFAPVTLAAAKAIFPATFLLYILPTVLQPLAAGAGALPSATGTVLAVAGLALLGTERDDDGGFFGTRYARYVELGSYTTFTALALVHLQGLDVGGPALASLARAVAGPEFVWLAAVVADVCFHHRLQRWLPLAVAAVALGCVVAGPGAMAVAVWTWREGFVSPAEARGGAAVVKT